MVKFYKTNLLELKEVTYPYRKTEFTFSADNGENMIIKVDESIQRINARMNDVISGERNKVYLSNGMMDVDISYLGNNKWQLFDEFDIYEFEYIQ